MDFKQLVLSWEGRLNRQPYWIASLILAALQIGIQVLAITTQIPALAILMLILVWPNVVIGIKRCHDRDRSGWFLLLGMIPVVNLWVLVELLFLKGTEGDNRFGSNPLAG